MPFSRWICTNNSKTMLLRIVYPGGHVELHDQPVTAAEIMFRNPRCCVTYPYVFQQPWTIVAPDTVLMLGQKFYVVPMSTIRKLQGLSPRSSPSPGREIKTRSFADEIRNVKSIKEEEDDDRMISTCCVFGSKNITKQSYSSKQHSRSKGNGGSSHDNCFSGLSTRVKTKENVGDMTKETGTTLSNAELSNGSNTLTRRKARDVKGNGLPKKVWSYENWQPSLDSITEE
ncbi:hypothetical protein RIF29_28321 [Crotalaria pallida]|uniref:Uncharacterized protein n=1 Tax=Crotalaria pallida TaxID=3830 RepID=A0AAN9ERU8_CROPI